MPSKPLEIPYRGDVWRIYSVLAAREGKWPESFLRWYLRGDPTRLPEGMADDAKEIRRCMREGLPLPDWSRRPTIEELNAKNEPW